MELEHLKKKKSNPLLRYHNMKLLITFLIVGLLTTLTSNSQNFTNFVDQDLNSPSHRNNFNFNYKVPQGLDITQPLYFFMSYSGPNQGIELNLQHKDIMVQLSKNTDYLGNNQVLIVGPLDQFFGLKQSGDWKLEILYDGFLNHIDYWGITTVPEPSSQMIGLIGCMMLVSYRTLKRYKHHLNE